MNDESETGEAGEAGTGTDAEEVRTEKAEAGAEERPSTARGDTGEPAPGEPDPDESAEDPATEDPATEPLSTPDRSTKDRVTAPRARRPAAVARRGAAARGDASRRRATGIWALLLTAALVLCGFGGFAYADAANDEDLEFAQQRDQVLNAGREHLAQLNSMDNEHIDAGLRDWLGATTGPLHDELKRSNPMSAEAFRQSKATARGTVTDASVTELDVRSGQAKLIATVRVERAENTGKEVVDRKRFEAGLSRTGDGWKLKSLTAITVGD